MATTYAQLKANIQDWMENDDTDFVAAIDATIIPFAELKIYRDSDLEEFRKYATTTLTVSDKLLTKPTDIVIDRYLKIKNASTVYSDLRRKDTSFINEFAPDDSVEGLPRFYSDYNDAAFILAPVPDSTYTVELAYTYRPTGLSSGNTTTWLGDNAPDVLQWACMIEAAKYTKQLPADLAMWKEEYNTAVTSLRREMLSRGRRSESRAGEPKG